MFVMKTRSSTGFTLIEVLIAALVLGIGILGLATTMLLGLKSDQGAYFRSQASAAAYDMADRIRLNRDAANDGAYNNISIDKDSTVAGASTCNASTDGCTPTQQAAEDIRQWSTNFTTAAGVNARLPNGRGQVTRDAAQRFVITVSWSETDWDGADPTQKSVGTESLSVTLSL